MSDSIENAAKALSDGDLVIMPTDTVYGVAADPVVPGAVQKLFDAKRRDALKQIPMLASSIEQVEKFGASLGPLERKLASAYWPGPLTIVLMVGDQSEGFRVPDSIEAIQLLEKAGGVLRVTSANLSGEPPALTAEEAVEYLGDSVSAVIDAGQVPGGIASSVLQVFEKQDGGSMIKIYRESAVTRDALREVIDDSSVEIEVLG